MAKKVTKTKKVKTKVTKKLVKEVPKKIEQQPLTAIHWLGITGGIITLLAGVLWLLGSLLSWSLEVFTWFSFGDLGIINIACGLVLLITGITLKKNFLRAGLVLLIFSIIALLVPPSGFVVGPVLAIIGAIIALIRAAQK